MVINVPITPARLNPPLNNNQHARITPMQLIPRACRIANWTDSNPESSMK